MNNERSGNRIYRHISIVALCLVCWVVNSTTEAHAGDVKFSLHEKSPVFDTGSTGAWDSVYVDPSAIVFHDGEFHMFYTGIPKWPHPLAIGYASSPDGINWLRRSPTPILTIEDTGQKGESVNSNSVIVTDEGQWVLYFSMGEDQTSFIGSVGRATASSPLGPWQVDPTPVLKSGPKGSWDGNKVGHAHVIKSDNGYSMYYSGKGDIQVGQFVEEHAYIGLATSVDGVNWTKHDDPATVDAPFSESDPILSPEKTEGSWDNWNVQNASVQRTPGGWQMVYSGSSSSVSGNFGIAASNDGINWKRLFNYPVLKSADIGKKIFFATYVRHDGSDFIYVEAGSDNGTKGYLAVKSADDS